jgi:hypothetical protein
MPAAEGVAAGGHATAVVRPESIRVGTGELRATVRRTTFLGPLVEYELAAGEDSVIAVDPDWMGTGLHEVGKEVAWSLRPDQAYLLPPAALDETAPVDPDAVPPDQD